MSDIENVVRDLLKRVEALEQQVALLKKAKKTAAGGMSRDYRDRYDALDYPDR